LALGLLLLKPLEMLALFLLSGSGFRPSDDMKLSWE
jgi:hypothetical protein